MRFPFKEAKLAHLMYMDFYLAIHLFYSVLYFPWDGEKSGLQALRS